MGAPWPGPGSGPATRPAAARRAAGRGAGVSVQTGRSVPVPVRARRGQLGLRPSPPLAPQENVLVPPPAPRSHRRRRPRHGAGHHVPSHAPFSTRELRGLLPGARERTAPCGSQGGSPAALTAPRCPRAPLRPRSRRLRIRGLVPRRTRGAGSHRLLLAAPGSSPAASCATKSQLKLTSSGATPLTSRKQPPAPAALSHDPGHLLTVT